MASYNGVQAAVLGRPGSRLILARSLKTSKNTCVAGGYPCSYSQVLGGESQHWGLAGVPLWYSRVPAGDVTCELYCS